MRKAHEDNITKMWTAFRKENIPTGVYLAFVDIIQRVTWSIREQNAHNCTHGTHDMDCQDSLRTLVILYDHLHIDWTSAIVDDMNAGHPHLGQIQRKHQRIKPLWNWRRSIWDNLNHKEQHFTWQWPLCRYCERLTIKWEVTKIQTQTAPVVELHRSGLHRLLKRGDHWLGKNTVYSGCWTGTSKPMPWILRLKIRANFQCTHILRP